MAVDGSVVKTLCNIAQAACLKNKFGESPSAWRLHTFKAGLTKKNYLLTLKN